MRVRQRTAELEREIIERKGAEEKIRDKETLLQMVFDGIADPLVVVGKDLSMKMLNRAAKEYYQVADVQEIISRPYYQSLEGKSPGLKSGIPGDSTWMKCLK